jgi:hypothetical protein
MWDFKPHSHYSVSEFDASNTDGVYLLTPTMTRPLTIVSQPAEKVTTLTKRQLLEMLKNEHGLTNVLIVDAGCNVIYPEDKIDE